MKDHFTWIPLYKELADCLSEWEDRQSELIQFIDRLRSEGLKVTPLTDQDDQGGKIPLQEIDPFTFLGIFNRQITEKERISILSEVKKFLNAKNPLPEDFHGIPVINNQRSWFFSYKFRRQNDDISKLWHVFHLALNNKDSANSEEFYKAFDDALQVWGVNINLTMGLFWIRPERFLNLDKTNREYLNIKLPPKGLTADFYFNTLQSVFQKGRPLPEISYDAWLSIQSSGSSQNKTDDVDRNDLGYWLVGAYWDGDDQTQRFMNEGIWQNGYDEKYGDEVRSMKVGDKIAIKAASTQKNDLPFDTKGNTVSKITIKSRGTITANRGDGKIVEVEWDQDFKTKEWYFFTHRGTVWRVKYEDDYRHKEFSRKLIDFIWNGKTQDYDWFLKQWYENETPTTLAESDTSSSKKKLYSIDDIIESGVFLEEHEISTTLKRLKTKKNLIIQGPPGVGKTFIARKLAYALMEETDDSRIEMVQFHQSYCYEDFVRGYRPLPEDGGKFGLQDAVFFKFCQKAAQDPDNDYVFIIDEINRGNLSQIFGELLMLIEADKRGANFAVPLMYSRPDEKRFFVPNNLYIIGMMNLADRSLAIVDYALRRRFSFMTLTPKYNSPIYRKWLQDGNMNQAIIDLVFERMEGLNQEICNDSLLGENYQVGHSFFCPKSSDFSNLDRSWYEGVIKTEIIPLLKEYWFDNTERANEMKERLLAP